MGSVHAVLNILQIVQVHQNTLTEGDAILVDEDVRGSVGVDVDNLKVDSRKLIAIIIRSFLLGHHQAR